MADPAVPNFAEALTESELTSLRKVIFDRFGDEAPILLERSRTRATRPYWRIDASTTVDIDRVASGWDDGRRGYVLGYYGSTRRDVTAHVEIARALIADSIPFRFYRAAWFPPVVEAVVPEDVDAPTLAPGTYSVAASFLSAADGSESLTSAPRSITLIDPAVLKVSVPSWPWRWPLRGYARAYLGLDPPGAPLAVRRLAGTSDDLFTLNAPVLMLDALPVSPAALEPTDSAVPASPLHVDNITMNVYENPDNDGEFDGVLSIFVTRPLYPPPIQGLATYGPGSVTVSHVPDPDGGVPGIH